MSIQTRERGTCERLVQLYGNESTTGCAAHFDKSLCWHPTSFNHQASRTCPFTFCKSIPGCDNVWRTFQAERLCATNGTWSDSNYAPCLAVLKDFKQCIVGYCHICPDPVREAVMNVSLTLSIVSVLLLIAALLLFNAFESLQCRRLWIHKQLAAAFVLRFTVLAMWNIAQSNYLFSDCNTFIPTHLWNLEIVCKLNLWFLIYFQVASVMWMLIEGAYLYSRFTVIGMRTDAPTKAYVLAGWGLPFVVVMTWTVMHQIQSPPGSFCWLPYAQGAHLWILAGAMGICLILNLLFMLGIVVILVQKLRTDSTAESKKIWRTIKATLLLVPLLGISNIPLFYEPTDKSGFYQLGSAILQHSQGIFIAVLYCFLNSEIQHAVKRRLAKLPCGFVRRLFSQSTNFDTERTYIPDPAAQRNRRITDQHHGSVPMEEIRAINGDHQKKIQSI